MNRTTKQAIDELAANPHLYNTPDSLRDLVASVSIDAGKGQTFGKTTVLYSGKLLEVPQGVWSPSANEAIEQMMKTKDVRVINQTHLAQFVSSDEFTDAVKLAFGKGGVPITSGELWGRSPANDFLFDPENGMWARGSKRFAAATVGHERVLAPLSVFGRTFGAVELPELLNNPNVLSIDGVPMEQIRGYGSLS